MKSYYFNFRLKTLNIDMSHSHLNGFGHMGYLDTIGSVCPDLTQLTVGYHSPSSSYDTKTALGLESGVITGASFAGQRPFQNMVSSHFLSHTRTSQTIYSQHWVLRLWVKRPICI